MKKILYFSHVNWSWIKQRPHFLAYYFAKSGHQVTFLCLNSITSFMTNPKLKIKNIYEMENLEIKTLNVLPLGYKVNLLKYINACLIKKVLDKTYETIILTHPFQIDYISKKFKGKIVYECMDNHPHFFNDQRIINSVIKKERYLIDYAYKIVTSSAQLKTTLMKRYSLNYDKVEVICNALDDETILNHKLTKIDIKRPCCVYIGTISEWIDFEMIHTIASVNSDFYLYMIGPIDKSVKKVIEKLPKNVIFIGSVEHDCIFDYIYYGDVMLLPFRVNSLIECVDPVKIYEYLAFNKPVMSTYWKQLDKHASKIVFYKNESDAKLLKEIIANNHNKSLDLNYIDNENWTQRIHIYNKILI